MQGMMAAEVLKAVMIERKLSVESTMGLNKFNLFV